VLVSSADGVGTKLKVAFLANKHDTVGIDLVNHCVNDILVQGARPLFFLDYLATGRLSPDVAEQIVSGMAVACRENRCALLGGETAEMPGFYGDGEYDLAGFIVGAVERDRIIDGKTMVPGDVLIGLPSSGLHTNGYSLARRIVFDVMGLTVDSHLDELGTTVGEALLVPHKSYLAPLSDVDRPPPRQGPRAHHRRRHHREPAPHPARPRRRRDRARRVGGPPDLPGAPARRRRPRARDVPRLQHGHRDDRRLRRPLRQRGAVDAQRRRRDPAPRSSAASSKASGWWSTCRGRGLKGPRVQGPRG
jgi:hypothetical protein